MCWESMWRLWPMLLEVCCFSGVPLGDMEEHVSFLKVLA
jgi:hypothetical protein